MFEAAKVKCYVISDGIYREECIGFVYVLTIQLLCYKSANFVFFLN